MKMALRIILIALVVALAGCATSNSGGVYSREETRQTKTVKMGVVESVRTVKIEGTKSGVGAVTGAAVGGIAGNSVGGGRGKLLTTVIGAVAGGLAGNAVEEKVTEADGLEITVKLENGNLIAIVQEADEQFHPGDHVRLIEGGGVTRVSH